MTSLMINIMRFPLEFCKYMQAVLTSPINNVIHFIYVMERSVQEIKKHYHVCYDNLWIARILDAVISLKTSKIGLREIAVAEK